MKLKSITIFLGLVLIIIWTYKQLIYDTPDIFPRGIDRVELWQPNGGDTFDASESLYHVLIGLKQSSIQDSCTLSDQQFIFRLTGKATGLNGFMFISDGKYFIPINDFYYNELQCRKFHLFNNKIRNIIDCYRKD
ncbi:MAG: hypothetical protein ACPGYY_01860 [Bacteroidia bacterium]